MTVHYVMVNEELESLLENLLSFEDQFFKLKETLGLWVHHIITEKSNILSSLGLKYFFI